MLTRDQYNKLIWWKARMSRKHQIELELSLSNYAKKILAK